MRRFLTVAILAMALGAGAAADEPGRIVVSGTGSVEAAPDMAVITLGVTTEAEAAGAAMDANSAAMAAVLARLSEAGVAERDLQTEALSLAPRWRHETGPDGSGPQITGFVASNTLSVRVRDLARLGDILDLAIADGANTLGGLRFGVSQEDEMRDAARAAAVQDARRKAELLADAAGVSLGRLLELREDGGAAPPVPMMRMEMAADSVPVAPGEVGLTASVSLTYAIVQ